MYSHVIVAIDGSDDSIRAAEEALRLAEQSKQTMIELVFVAEHTKETAKAQALPMIDAFETSKQNRQQTFQVEAMFEEEGVPYVLTELYGNPGKAIADYANEKNADLVIIGSRGIGKMKQWLLGSVSQRVVNEAACPVLVMKHR